MSVHGEAASSRPTRLGRYELITRIGQGGMAEVQLALQRGPAGFEKLVVVKLVHESLASQKTFVDMLLDEARVAALVKHPNVVDIYDLGQAEGRYFIAMEYLEGEPLLAVLRAGREGRRLDALSTGRLIADTAEGLDAAHELRSMSGERIELVHHDISLGNIVVLYNGQVKLVDFGVAKATMSATTKSKVQGKFSYMAPEKLKGAQGDRRSDIFSLGCVMWEALTLRRLFRGGNDSETMRQVLELSIQPPSKVNSDVPPEYDAIVMRALDRDPARRQRTAKELAVELEELLRKRGYGAKNDKIARYMQDTFKTHIDARKKLVQEVVSKGMASVEVIDAAFSDPVFAAGSPITPPHQAGEFAMSYRRVMPATGVPILPPVVPLSALSDMNRPTEVSPIPDMGGDTEISAPPVIDDVDDNVSVSEIELIPARESLADRARAIVRDPHKRLIAGGAIGSLVLVVLLLVAIGRGGGSKAEGTGSPASGELATTETGSASPDPVPSTVSAETGSAETGSAAAGSAAAGTAEMGSAANAIEPPPVPPTPPQPLPLPANGSGSNHHVTDHVVHHPPPPPQPPPPAVDVEAVFHQGLQAFLKGDTHGALTLLQRAKSAKPSYAPTWRVLGQVYERMGERGPAKTAYQRYLALAPSAPDAKTIRDRLEHL